MSKHTIQLSTLIDEIHDAEREIAPGSESSLWGEFGEMVHRINAECAVFDTPDDYTVPAIEAAWWLGAYTAAIYDAELRNDVDADGRSTIPDAPMDADADRMRELLGLGVGTEIDTECERQMLDGYRWYYQDHAPRDAERLYGIAEIAEALDEDKRHTAMRKSRGELPEPDAVLAMGPVWRTSTIEPWIEARRARKQP